MKTIGVLGLGNWGTALGNHLANKGFDVIGWSIEDKVVNSVNTDHVHPTFLKGVILNPKLRATGEIKTASEADYVVLVVPAAVLAEVWSKVSVKDSAVVISAIKGLDPKTLQTPIDYVKSRSPKIRGLAAISGPSFAIDVANLKPCGLVAASENEAIAREVAELFGAPTMKLYVSTDPTGVEIGAVVKNVIAIAAGVCDGLGLGESARAGLITRGLAETVRLAKAMGAQEHTLYGLSGLGDLLMTASCDTSRNRTVGLRLGRGENLDHILKTLGSVAEGVPSTYLVKQLAQNYNVEMPITFEMAKLLKHEIAPQEAVKNLLSRSIKREF